MRILQTLQGIYPTGLTLTKGEKLGRTLKNDQKGLGIPLIDFTTTILHSMETDPALSALVDQYHVVFKEPKGLPPFREHDHHILTPKDAKPMCVGPYWYPYYQKIEIEKLINKMLSNDII